MLDVELGHTVSAPSRIRDAPLNAGLLKLDARTPSFNHFELFRYFYNNNIANIMQGIAVLLDRLMRRYVS